MVRDITIRHAGSGEIAADFRGKDIISLGQFCPRSLDKLFKVTAKMRAIGRNSRPCDILAGFQVILLFYEESSRTRVSFDSAVGQLGGNAIVIVNPQQFSSVAKGESFEDSIRTYEAYSDAIVLRHPEVGSAKKAADTAEYVPIFNAGDGIGEHPTQALLDLFTIWEKFQRLSGLTGLIVGDIKNGRTIHSLIKGLLLYPQNSLYLLSPQELRLSESELNEFREKEIRLEAINYPDEAPRAQCDFIYWTRIQQERMDDVTYKNAKDRFICTPELMNQFTNPNMILMHPLPRVNEIDPAVDKDPRAVYLRSQTRNGMYVRMALMSLILDQVPLEWGIP